MRSVKEVIRDALSEGRSKLLEHEAIELVKHYGIPVPNTIFVKNAKEAYDVADSIGYPIVVKVVSPDIVHKSDVGGVSLGLKSKEEVLQAIKEMQRNISIKAQGAKILGYIMYHMAPPGTEVIVGGTRDPVFGAVIMFGLGGIFVEVLKDVSFRVAPITVDEALEMINEIRCKRILEGYRGQQGVNKKALADIIVKISQLMLEIEEIDSIDLNPVIAYPSGAVVVDVRVILRKSQQL
ncbi:MAG: acetate--CoA ligase family protein [Desulfurococcaceae archaeon]|nr:acetate--CoA ligase family protein [Desulfurococcaceae archaeon]